MALIDKYVGLFIEKSKKFNMKYMGFNVEIEDIPISSTLPEVVKKNVLLLNNYIEVIEYEYDNLNIFVVIPKKGFGIIVSDNKEKFIEKLNKVIKRAQKKAERNNVDGKVCIPFKSYLTKEIEINCVNVDEYISSEVVSKIAEFYE